MKRWAASFSFSMLLVVALSGCDDRETCTQENVDECYLTVGCDGSKNCTLTTSRMNDLCVCLGDLGCDQVWYHAYCDDAPYEDGECGQCDDESESDGGGD